MGKSPLKNVQPEAGSGSQTFKAIEDLWPTIARIEALTPGGKGKRGLKTDVYNAAVSYFFQAPPEDIRRQLEQFCGRKLGSEKLTRLTAAIIGEGTTRLSQWETDKFHKKPPPDESGGRGKK